MNILIGFTIGIAIGIYGFFGYLKDKLPVNEVLSTQTEAGITNTITPSPSVTITYNVDAVSETPTTSPTPTLKPNSVTPTKKPSVAPTRNVSATPSVTITISPTQNITVSPSPIITATVTPTPAIIAVQTFAPGEIYGLFDRFAGQYGVDANVLRHIAQCESGFNPLARSPNGLYAGLYQFGAGAWTTYRKLIGEDSNPDLRLSAEEAIQTAAYIVSIGKSSIWPNCLP